MTISISEWLSLGNTGAAEKAYRFEESIISTFPSEAARLPFRAYGFDLNGRGISSRTITVYWEPGPGIREDGGAKFMGCSHVYFSLGPHIEVPGSEGFH